MTHEQKLIEVIEHELAMGFRHFMLRGAELDIVLAALRAAEKNTEAAAFLDALAERLGRADCRAMAKKLRGEM